MIIVINCSIHVHVPVQRKMKAIRHFRQAAEPLSLLLAPVHWLQVRVRQSQAMCLKKLWEPQKGGVRPHTPWIRTCIFSSYCSKLLFQVIVQYCAKFPDICINLIPCCQ